MPITALVLYAIFLGLTVGLRVAIQVRRTGSTGVYKIGGEPGSREALAGFLFALGAFVAPVPALLALLGVLDPIAALNTSALHLVGLVLGGVGTLLVFGAQMAMGNSWRVGVDPDERTELVTTGIFGIVRNPIFALSIPTVFGLTLMVPSVLAILDFAVVVVSIELLVRAVEEPYLLRTHGNAFRDYASHVGRFVPGVGLMSPAAPVGAAGERSGAA